MRYLRLIKPSEILTAAMFVYLLGAATGFGI